MPTLNANPVAHTFIRSSDPNFNFGLNSFVPHGIPSYTVKGLVRFDLSAIPSNAVIVSATLAYRTGTLTGGSQVVGLYRSLVDWYAGTSNGTTPPAGVNASTWNYRNNNGPVGWAGGAGGGAGSDYASSPFSTQTISATDTTFTFDVASEVTAIKNGTVTNRGWWIYQTSPSGRYSTPVTTDLDLTVVYTTSQVVAPTAISARGETTQGNITIGLLAAPSNANAVSGTVGPTVLVQGETINGRQASAVAGTVNPTVEIGGQTVLGAVAGAVAGRANPSIAIAADIDPAYKDNARGSTVNPTVIKSGGPDVPLVAGAVGGVAGPASLVDLTLRPSPATAVGATTARVVALRLFPEACTPDPILVITDGTFKDNGQRNWLSLIRQPFMLNEWRPNIAQYKSGGIFSDSALANGRRLVRRSFGNAIEVMDMRAKGGSQDLLFGYIQELFAWQEAAADYWVSDWGSLPIFLIAKAAKETNPRYAVIHTISVPELSNPYAQPVFSRYGGASLDTFTVRIERGPWTSTPPGFGECVPLSAKRSWTVAGWGSGNTSGGGATPITGNILSLIQTDTGDILAGTNDQGKIYRSSDNGLHWVQVAKLGTVTGDNINAFAKTASGAIFAAVTGGVGVRGIWKSTNHGTTWTRSLNADPHQGFKDITYSVQQGILGAGGGSDTADLWNVTTSHNEGAAWYFPISHQSLYGVNAVAGQQEPVLATAYPGQATTDPFNKSGAIFVGYDTYYTIAGVVYQTSNPITYDQYIPGSGQMGNRGLDMAVFLHKNPQGSYYRKALWAVKSAADTTDTEIWQWPNPAGGFNFGKLATIDNKIFNVLYVDPVAWQNIPAQRTIWAGGNGELLVSYNNGLTWTVATTAPVNQIRAILRTTAGTLITGGDSGEVFIYTGSSGSQGGNVDTPAVPVSGGTVVNTYSLGMEESCDDDVIVANKSTFTNLTHVLHFNGSTFSELQFAAVPPYELLGATAVVNKAVYFGSKTSDTNVPGGTFSNVIFELTRIAENITVVWEYWNGAAWATLTVQDSSAGFRTMGPGSVHWVIPGAWSTTAVNSITGYWVRARISAVGTNPVTPVHDNVYSHRYIYTANLPYVEVSEDGVTGDLPAAAQIRWHNRSDDPGATIDLEVDRMVCGLRSVSRGNYFNAYLNISDRQVPFGFSISKDADGIWSDYFRSPTNRILTMSYASAGRLNAWNDLVTFSLSNTVARDYYGTYRVFVRVYKYGAGSNTWQLRVKTSFGTGGNQSLTKAIFPGTGTDWETLDFGPLTIPTSRVSFIRNNLGDSLTITVQGNCTTTGNGLVLYDLILIPTDEWALDSQSPNPSISDVAKVKGDGYLDIDSITNPKVLIAATNRNSADQIVSNYQTITNGSAMLQTRQQQRLWMLVMSYENYWRAFPEVAGSVQAYKQQQYQAFRGKG